MSASTCFEYGGYHFFPLRRFAKDEGDFFALSRRLEEDPSIGLTAYKEKQKFPYSYENFYKTATNPNYDIFCCVEMCPASVCYFFTTIPTAISSVKQKS